MVAPERRQTVTETDRIVSARPARPVIYVASLETRNFHFEAFAKSRIKARAVLLGGLRRHARQCGIDAEEMVQDLSVSIEVRPVELNTPYRDKASLR